MGKLASAVAFAFVLFFPGGGGGAFAEPPVARPAFTEPAVKPPHKPSATCPDADLEEHIITDELAAEPERPRIIVTGWNLDVFKWNMKWAFNIDVDADTVYIIQAMTPGSHEMHVHVFTVKEHCITYYTVTWAKVISEMLRYDAWEIEHPAQSYADPTMIPPVPAGRPAPPRYHPAQ